MDDTGDRAEAAASARSGTAISMRWWDAGLAMTVVVMVVLATTSSSGRVTASFVAVGLLVLTWFALARPVVRRADALLSLPTVTAVAALVVVGGVTVAATPELAVVQAFLMPLIWTLLPGTRSAIVANVCLCVAISIGFVVSLGWSAEALATAATSEGLSLVFSIALGMWITTIARVGVERGRLLDELREAQAELAARHRDAGTSTERERLAREIHDTIAQSLTGVVMLAQQTRGALAAGDLTTTRERLDVIEAAAREALTEARTLVAATASTGPAGTDVAAALHRLGARFERESGIGITVDAVEVDLPRDLQVVLVRCTQEALANVRKHSASTSARVTLTATDGTAVLVVSDDGTGFDTAVASTGFGLDGLRERLELSGGRLDVSSDRDGTVVTAQVPRAAVVTP
ncbi:MULTISPECIES: sensor histidine kinase [unclassified Frigoribacterium]|uniref:sensor histidine kinase n=1 Tax=unclassified Frigoribacterium TaxID=2627005 RepID=UPI0015640917|nr:MULTISPECIES: sensor histidine kinase [unclassified Frigoribacterium]NQW86641.1 sensor histidine kinase [Frigoribacterium sp. VKM Ac-2860]NQX07972.1 sensor histidine kinase [Frigoribacterium sp. VKM Ac-2859]